ncbi:MAG: DinB family protein [Bryobacteraceae bacterium]|nr:DinB family protein [Bryobacteraceae bacterium]
MIAPVIFARLDEDLAIVEDLLALAPANHDDWRPDWPGFSVSELAAHLVESAGGLCGCLARLDPSCEFQKSETLGHTPAESLAIFSGYRRQFQAAAARVTDADLTRVIPTYFAPAGEPFLAILLTNAKHLNHHAHQLFTYWKMLGLPVRTRNLYRFR